MRGPREREGRGRKKGEIWVWVSLPFLVLRLLVGFEGFRTIRENCSLSIFLFFATEMESPSSTPNTPLVFLSSLFPSSNHPHPHPLTPTPNPRYDDIVAKMTPFLRGCGYQPKDLVFLPIAGLMGVNVMERVDPGVCGWYQGPALFEVLDKLEQLPRSSIAPFRMPIMDKYKGKGEERFLAFLGLFCLILYIFFVVMRFV